MIKLTAVSEDAFLIQLSEKIDLRLTDQIAYLVTEIETQLAPHLLDITPSYTTILVQYNLLTISPLVVEQLLLSMIEQPLKKALITASKQIELPVYYDPSVGWDLQKLAQQKGLSIEQIIKIHSATEYKVCAIGFAPGFAFLGQLPKDIQAARLTSPRAFVPAGSVAIADSQTAVYPADSPGGWQIIGNCPIKLFDLNQSPISPFNIGDHVKFKAISLAEFVKLGGQVSDEK